MECDRLKIQVISKKFMISFKNLQLINPIVRAVTEAGYSKPTEIQNEVIPIILEGKDVLASAPKGSGKKAAFAVPMLQLLKRNTTEHTKIRALILTSTDELAVEIERKLELYSKYLPLIQLRINESALDESQLASFKKRVDVLVATPERLMETSQRRAINLSKLEIFVLYNADKMFEKESLTAVKNIQMLIPKDIQTLVFCESISDGIRKSVSTIVKNPSEVIINGSAVSLNEISQKLFFVEKRDKTDSLIDLLTQQKKSNPSLVFTNDKYTADEVVENLEKAGFRTGSIYGNKTQNAKSETLAQFRTNQIDVLVTTDIATKGMDIDEISNIISYDLPNTAETYIQRIKRLSSKGSFVSFCTTEEHEELKNIQKLIGFAIPVGNF